MLKIDLFEGIEDKSVLELLKCIGIKTKTFKKNTTILHIGDKINYLGVMLEGSAVISKPDIDSNEVILEKLKTNDIFGHNIVCCDINKSPVRIYTLTGCEILFLPYEKIVTPCEKLCPYHLRMIKNIMKMISKRNILLSDKIDIIGQKTIREKILTFLESYKSSQGAFYVPYSREEMARFLCTDRSALSRELSRMQSEGIIKFKKNCFELLK